MDIGKILGYIKQMKEGFVYIIQSIGYNRYYIGSTVDFERRLVEHNSGKTIATKNKGPWKFVFIKKYNTLVEARRLEYKLKRFKSRKIIERIIKDEEILTH